MCQTEDVCVQISVQWTLDYLNFDIPNLTDMNANSSIVNDIHE